MPTKSGAKSSFYAGKATKNPWTLPGVADEITEFDDSVRDVNIVRDPNGVRAVIVSLQNHETYHYTDLEAALQHKLTDEQRSIILNTIAFTNGDHNDSYLAHQPHPGWVSPRRHVHHDSRRAPHVEHDGLRDGSV